MNKKVFFCYDYENDTDRAMVVKEVWGEPSDDFISTNEFSRLSIGSKVKLYDWIDKQLDGTVLTVILLGNKTLDMPYVQYAVKRSLEHKNGLLGIFINTIVSESIPKALDAEKYWRKNSTTQIDTVEGYPRYFNEVCSEVHDFNSELGYTNLKNWIQSAISKSVYER